jgi:hypothetical protein
MVAREFQSYTFKWSVDFVNAIDVVDAADEPRRGGIRCSEAGKEKKNFTARVAFLAVQDAAAAWEESGGARKSAAAEDLAMPLSGN